MCVEKLAENFHSHASAYGLVKDHFGPAALAAGATYYTLMVLRCNRLFQIFEKFFAACVGRVLPPRFRASLGLLTPRAKEDGDDRDRTGNLRLAKPALSQLSYVPEPLAFMIYDFRFRLPPRREPQS